MAMDSGKGCWNGMKQYRIDELRYQDYEALKAYLEKNYASQVEGVYWMPLEKDLLDGVQAVHMDCQPFYFAVELTPEAITFELLVRTRQRVRCDCMRYANVAQRESIIRLADALFEQLKILS